jgi:sulfite exporter TauE/SafE
MNTLSYTMALLMGFTGSLHCAGMCGPIVWIMPFQAFKGIKKAAALALYHGGRISVYALLAVILHSFKNLFDPKVQQYISIILGVTLLITGILTFIPNHYIKLKLPWADAVKKQLGNVIGRPGLSTLLFTGILNGLLPCGLVYMALSASLAATSTLQTVGMMYLFGLGTLPMLISITILKTKLTFLRTANIRKMVPVVVFAFGCLFVLRGMNLGIPYLSPKVVVEQHGIKSCCCHKK